MDSVDQPLVLMVTEKRERDVLGQIVVPLASVDDCRSAEPLRVPLQPGLRYPHPLTSSPGELVYNLWITTENASATPESRSLTSKIATAKLSKLALRRKLNASPISSASRWNDFKTSRRHSTDALLDLTSVGFHSASSPDLVFYDDRSPTTPTGDFVPVPSSDGYIKRSSLPSAQEYYFSRPQILEVWPSEGPTTGGTVLTVRGRDLGVSRDDVIALLICGSDVLESVQYISSERMVCATAAWKPCVGCVTVETASGGRASSAAQFTFIAGGGSEPPTPRAVSSPSDSPMANNQRRRFSLSELENIESFSSSLDRNTKPWSRTAGKNVFRRRKREDLAATRFVVDAQRRRSSDDVTSPPSKLSQIEEDSCWKFDDEKVAPVSIAC